jgi:hypothetical protein
MHFGQKTFYGTPFYLNGEIAGWVCTTMNGLYNYVLAKYNIKSDDNFKTELEAKLSLMKIFGE